MAVQSPTVDTLLTPRQLEVLELMAKGLSNREIAGVLDISFATVKNHVAAVIDALDVTNRTEATNRLHELGLGTHGGPTADEFRVDGFGFRPAIAVLPFESFSNSPEHDYLADAIVEDLTTGLANWRWFPVVSRNSAYAYKGQPIDVQEVSRALGVGYVVEGSIRSMGDRIRVTVQVLDGADAHHLWAESFDCQLAQIHQELDTIVERVVSAIEPALAYVGGMRAGSRRPEQLDAWANANRGLLLLRDNTIDSFLQAAQFYDRSIALAPDFPGAHSGLAYCRLQCHHHHVAVDAPHQPEGFRDAADRTERLDPNDPETHLATAVLRLLDGDRERGLAAAERCVQVGPSNGWAHHIHASALNANGRPEEACEAARRALRLIPVMELLHAAVTTTLATCELERRRVDDARELFTAAVREAPNLASGYTGLAICAVAKGELEHARSMLRRMKEVAPGYAPLRAYRFMAPPQGFDAARATFAAIGWHEAEFD